MSAPKTLDIPYIPITTECTLSSGEKIIGIAAFKNNIEPYGGFANTTLCTAPPKYPVTLDKYLTLNNQEQDISTLGIKRNNGSIVTAFNWKSSENAYHAQKLLAFRQKFPTKSAIIDQMLLELEEMPTPPTDTFLPTAFTDLVNKYHDDLGVNDAKDFHTKCSMGNSYQYMKFVVKQKLLKHKDLLDKAKACALAGIMPIEISQLDKVWASFIDGSGANQLGIIILELGNEFLIRDGEGQPKISDPKMAYQELQSKLPLGYSTNLDGKQLQEYVETPGLFKTFNVKVSAPSAKPAAKVAPAQPTKLVEPNKLSIRFKEISSDNHEISLQFHSIEELLEFKQQFINKLLARDPNLSPEVAAATVEQIFKYYPNTTDPNDHKNKILYIKQAFNKSSDPLSPQYTPGVYKDKISGKTVIDFKDQHVRDVFLELTSIDSKEYKTHKDRLEKVYFESKVLDTDNSLITTNLSYPQHQQITYVLNAHGGKTSEPLTLDPQHVIITPAPIDTAFTTTVDDGSVLEQEIHKGQLLDTTGKWTAYNNSSLVTNINFDTGYGFDTITSFANFSKTNDTWESINPDLKYNSANWGYFEQDPDATLVVKRNGNLIHIKGKNIKTYLEEVNKKYDPIGLDATDKSLKLKSGETDQTNSVAKAGDVPVFCCFPKVHKIKVFSKTNLQEVSEQLKKIHREDQVSVVVATCNAAKGATPITIAGTTNPTKLSELVQPLLPKAPNPLPADPPEKKATAKKSISTLKIKTLDGTKTSKLDGKLDKLAINLYSESCKKYFTELIQKNKDNHEFKDVKYIQINPTQANQNTVGELRRTATTVTNPDEVLATVKLDTIEFSIPEGKDTLINAQHLASIEFLKIQSEQSSQDNPIIIDVNNYSPQDLKDFLELLNKISKISNVTLELPSSKEQCTYRDDIPYTVQEYQDAVALINAYNNKDKIKDKSEKAKSEDKSTAVKAAPKPAVDPIYANAKRRVLAKIPGSSDLEIVDDINQERHQKVLKVMFKTAQDAQAFAASQNITYYKSGELFVVLGPKKARDFFEKNKIPTHGSSKTTKQYPMMKALIYYDQQQRKRSRLEQVQFIKNLSEGIQIPSKPTLQKLDTTKFTPNPDKAATKLDLSVAVDNEDCLVAAKKLIDSGHKPLVINLANRNSICGGWEGGALAQEESICSRSNYYKSLYQVDHKTFPNTNRRFYQNPIPHDSAHYSEGVTVLCDTDHNQYQLKDRFTVDLLAIAGYDLGAGDKQEALGKLSNKDPKEIALFNAYEQDKASMPKPPAEQTYPNLAKTFTELT